MLKLALSVVGRAEGLVGFVVLGLFLCLAAAPDLFVGRLETAATATGDFLAPPDMEHLLGTDEVGRDILNLTVHGARTSLAIASLATLVTLIIGTVVGIVSGFFGGLIDTWLMRLTDFFFVIPPFILALVITPVMLELIGRSGQVLGFRPSLFVIVLVIGLTSWSFMARIVRSQTISLRERPFVDRARVAGVGNVGIMVRHILPNTIPQIAANAALTVASAVATETALAFIGLGDPLQPSWGTILFLAQRAGAASVGAWWYFGAPGACVLVVVLSFVLIGSAVDDSLNPRKRVIP
jgi:peptide/nickel transport system permease protein